MPYFPIVRQEEGNLSHTGFPSLPEDQNHLGPLKHPAPLPPPPLHADSLALGQVWESGFVFPFC